MKQGAAKLLVMLRRAPALAHYVVGSFFVLSQLALFERNVKALGPGEP